MSTPNTSTLPLGVKTVAEANALAMKILAEPKMERLYKSTKSSIKYIFTNGQVAPFIRGRFSTADEYKIQQLDAEIKAGHPDIYVDVEEMEIDPRLEDPRLKMRAELIKELGINVERAVDPDRDMGTYDPGKLNPANTTSIAPVAAGGSGVQLKAQLAGLMNPK